jgi:hypothetical protein
VHPHPKLNYDGGRDSDNTMSNYPCCPVRGPDFKIITGVQRNKKDTNESDSTEGDNEFYDVSNSRDTNTDGDSQTLLEYGDNNGLLFASMCNPANNNDMKCFDTRREKKCDHKIDKVALNELGQYVIFPSRWWHRGFYEIRSEKEYYTAQLFCTAAQDPQSWTTQLCRQNMNKTIGRIPVHQMNEVSKDVQENWDTTYSVRKFRPSKAFDGKKIDPESNRHLQDGAFRTMVHMNNLVEYFENHFRQLQVKSVWIIKKTRDNNGF